MNQNPWDTFLEIFATLRHAGHDRDICGKLAWAEAMNVYYQDNCEDAEAACIKGLRNVIAEDTK
jgi:hypothetical protein